ncbi:hypothetical protein WA026_008643 [Henosepilachna vigintioctopunctata]|uniref:Secreted protein n=1 Tax=Henosepilachna vigintioctopunctata TaxID=420089 RepID=A0AAW1UHY2_9CUCU
MAGGEFFILFCIVPFFQYVYCFEYTNVIIYRIRTLIRFNNNLLLIRQPTINGRKTTHHKWKVDNPIYIHFDISQGCPTGDTRCQILWPAEGYSIKFRNVLEIPYLWKNMNLLQHITQPH